MDNMQPKLIIVTNGNYFARLVLQNTFCDYQESISAVVIVTGDYKGRTSIRSLWYVGKMTTFPYLFYKIFTVLIFNILQKIFPQTVFSVQRLAKFHNIPVHFVTQINTEEARALIGSYHPDLIISVSCPQLIQRKIRELAQISSLNIHSSLLPTYAGLAPYYWVLSNGEKVTGTTVHYMVQRFDEGAILVQKQLKIQHHESAFHLFKRLAELGSKALAEAIPLAFNAVEGQMQDLSRHSYFSHPNLKSYLNMRRNGHVLIRPNELFQTVKAELQRIFS